MRHPNIRPNLDGPCGSWILTIALHGSPAGSGRIWERGAALTSRVQSFETELLTQEENLSGLAAINRELIARAEAIDSPQRVVLDMDSTEIPVYGQQEQSTYNKYYESTRYQRLLRAGLGGLSLYPAAP
jgi:hypothetical protein